MKNTDVENIAETKIRIKKREGAFMNSNFIRIHEQTKLLKATEVAKFLAVSRSQAYRLMKRSEIPTVRFGGSIRVRECDLEEFIQRSWTGWKEA